MSGVVGMIEILQHTHLDDDQQRMLDTIHCSSLALLSLLNDILDYSESETNTLDIEHIPMQLLE
jgi:two-component system sensor histidine kinase EvgS